MGVVGGWGQLKLCLRVGDFPYCRESSVPAFLQAHYDNLEAVEFLSQLDREFLQCPSITVWVGHDGT